MVNPGVVSGYLSSDLDMLPPAAQHRAYSIPSENEVSPKADGEYTKDDIYAEKTLDGSDKHDVDGVYTTDERNPPQQVLKTATWLSTFFLITTDVLGPSVAPWAMSLLGYVPGSLVMFSLGVVATYASLVLLNLFIKLDTPETPIRTFSDLTERIFSHYGYTIGRISRHVSSFLQGLQLLMAVSILIFGSGAVLSQLVNFNLCFVICTVIIAIVGNVGGLIKSFQRLSILANFSVWMNLTICFLCMGVAQNAGALNPSTNAIVPQSQIVTAAFLNTPFAYQATAISNIIYAYGGATMYVELMAEMKNPREFWKSLAGAEFIIIGMYMLFGLYFYSEQGQFTNNIPQATLANLTAQQAANSIGLITGFIAAIMYGNVGLKVIYFTIVNDVFDGPLITTKKGTIVWSLMSTAYWWTAFIIASSVPNLGTIVGVVGSLCIMQFSYTFPSLMQLLYYINQGTTIKEKLTQKWALKAMDLTIVLASLAATGIGMWGSIEGMIQALQAGGVLGWGCENPQYLQ